VNQSHAEPVVLVIDDEPMVRTVVERVLTLGGYRVLLAESADDAVAQFGDDPGQIDAILLDVNLPGMPSEEVVWAFGRPVPTIGIVLMSGYGRETFEDRFPECLVDRYLRKPFTGEALRQALQRAMARSA